MNPVKSLINEARSFPPYFQMIDALNANIQSEKKIYDGLSTFLNQDISLLFNDQPEELKKCIQEIQVASKKHADVVQNMITTQSVIPNSLTIVNSLYNDITQEFSLISNARDTAVKSQEAMEKANQNLKKMKNQKNVDQAKLEQANQAAKSAAEQCDRDQQNAEHVKNERSKNIVELRKQLVESLAISLKSLAQVRESVSKQLAQISTELTNSLLFLDESNEPTFSSLEERLNQLNNETIE